MSAAMIGLIIFGAFLLSVGVTYVWALCRGLAKTRMRVLSILTSAVLAVISTLIAKSMIATEKVVSGIVVPLLEHMNVEGIGELIGMSATLNEVLLGCIGAMIAPILCVCFFWIWSLINWIAFVIVSLCLNEGMKRENAKTSLKPLRILAWAVGSTVISFTILMIPVSVYTRIAPVIVTELIDSGVTQGESKDAMQALVDDYIDPVNENPMTATYRFFGGEGLDHLITDFKVRGTKTHLEDELGAVASFGCNIYRLSQTKLENYGEQEAAVILAVADSFDRSELLPTIVGEVIYNATDSWIKGEDFLGVKKPEAGELFTPFLDVTLEILHQDAQDTPALQADIRTLASMISTLAKHEIFAHLSDPNALIAKLDGAGAINDLVTCLGTNESMKVLIPEITNLGIRAIADTLGIPADSVEIYETFMEDVAGDLNELKSLSGEARVDALNEMLSENFDKAGLKVDAEILDCYSVSIANDLLDQAEGDITADDVRAFFVLYAMNANKEAEEEKKDPTDPVSFNGLFAPTVDADLLKGTVYENMTEEELAKTGAATLAKVTARLSDLEGEDIQVQALSIVLSSYTNLLGAEHKDLAVLSRVNVTSAVSDDVIKSTASLQSADELGKSTMRVTVDLLVVKSKEAAELINSFNLGKEVDVIQSVIKAAGDVLGNANGFDLSNINSIAASVGKVLDALNESGSFGSEQTANLFKAVLQSDQIREAADLDMETATKLSDKATVEVEGKVDYSSTLQSVSGSITIVTQMGKGEEIKEENLVEMIQNLTPSTAGMIEVYVTADRMMGYGVPAKCAPLSASMISTTFGYLAEDDVEDFDAEAAALNQMLKIAMAARESKEKKLFDGILPGANETVEILLKSKAIQHSLKTNLTDGTKVTEFDPFELGGRLQDAPEDVAAFTAALQAYHTANPQTDVLVLEALAAIFGITITF